MGTRGPGARRVVGAAAAGVLCASLLSLAGAVSPLTPAASAAQVPVGNDISWPQCGSAFPSGQAYGIVGVNDGRPGTLNPCLAPSATYPALTQSELYWAASTSSGTSTQPKASVYVNTADPGNMVTGTVQPDWPTSGSTPYGTCTTTTVTTSSGPETLGANSPACAWEYGDQKAAQDAAWLRAGAQAVDAASPSVPVPETPSGYPWWLDVETANSWQKGAAGQAMNTAALQGIVSGLTAAGATTVGVYSTSYMWGVITGGTTSGTATIGRLPTWVPGAGSLTGAETLCGDPSFTAGPVTLAQYPSGSYDGDLSCDQTTFTRVYGQTADATAAAEMERAFPSAKGSCPPTRTAVVATTQHFQDALSSQALAGSLTTGTLLTPTASLSQATASALQVEGIDAVDVVGGPLAVSTAVVSQIESLTAYECGGTTRTSKTGKIAVHRIDGQTQYGTAEAVAELLGKAPSRSFAGAYTTTDATGGTGLDNDTAGTGTSPPASSEPTAILASGEEFQDAQAVSVASYRTRLPMLLTPAATLSTTAVSAIEALGVRQVVLVGGPLAVTNAVEQDLVERTGVSVLRVAGKGYTDTAREIARFELAGATGGLGWTPGRTFMVARGDGYTDGLCGAVLDDTHNTATGPSGSARPLLLTEGPTTVGTYLAGFLETTGHTGIRGTGHKQLRAITVLGGPLAVTTATVAAMRTDLSR